MNERPSEVIRKNRLLPLLKEMANEYEEKLLGKCLLIVYRKQDNGSIGYIEARFRAFNFMHLIGADSDNITAAQFFQRASHLKLSLEDFYLKDETELKLAALPSIINLTKKANMIGDFNGLSKTLYTEKLAGGTYACMGFVINTGGIYVPNTVLNKNTRDMVKAPYSRILAIYEKFREEKDEDSEESRKAEEAFLAAPYPHRPVYICKDLKAKADCLKWPDEIMRKIEEG